MTERSAPDWLLPRPTHIAPAATDFPLVSSTPLVLSGANETGLQAIATQLSGMLARGHGLRVDPTVMGEEPGYRLTVGCPAPTPALPDGLGLEGYLLQVDETGARAVAATVAGIRWAAMTLYQLCRRDGDSLSVAGCQVEDAPRYPWRGVMVDAGRAPSSLASLQRLVSFCASFKINHLVYREGDDELNAVAYSTTPLGSENPCALSLADIETLIAHGESCGVSIVPEIECLGHSRAKARHYPELVEGGIETRYGDVATHTRKSHLRPGDERSYDLIGRILSEWLPRQATPYVHIGMDEVRLPKQVQAAHLDGLLPRLEALGMEHDRPVRPIVWADAPPTPADWRDRVVRCLWDYAEHDYLGPVAADNPHLVSQGIGDLLAEECCEQAIMAGGSGSAHRPYGKSGVEVAIENLAAWARLGAAHPNFIGLLAVQWGGNMLELWLPDFIAAADFGWTPPAAPVHMNGYCALVHEHIYGLDRTFPRVSEPADAPCWDAIWLRDGRFHRDLMAAAEAPHHP